MTEPTLEIRNIRTEADIRETNGLFARCFSQNSSYYEHVQRFDRDIAWNPCMNPADCWVIEIDGAIIGSILISIIPIRIGQAVLKMGGIGGVCTEYEFRKKGYNERLMKHCIEYMTKIGLDISLLGGIPNYYQRYGYAVVMPGYEVSIPAEKVILEKAQYSVRKYESQDLERLMSLYENEFSAITGTQVRSQEYWHCLKSDSPEIYVAEDAEKVIRGYIWLKSEKDRKIIEACGRDAAAISSLLFFMRQEAQKRFQSKIIGQLHPQQPFTRFALPEYGGEMAIRYSINGGWMGRLINLQSTFKKLEKELTKRMLASGFNNWLGQLQFKTDLDSTSLEIAAGHVKAIATESMPDAYVCEVNQNTLIQMVFGYCAVEEIFEQQKLNVAEEIIPLLNILFPQRHGYISVPDHF